VLLDSYDEKAGQDLSRIGEMGKAMSGTESYHIYQLPDGEKTMYVAVPIIYNNEILGVVLSSASMDGIFEDISSIMAKVYFLAILGLIITVAVGLLMADIIFRPIERMKEAVIAFGKGKYDTKLKTIGNDEIGDLGAAFNSMASQISMVEENRRTFVSNVSHELRTPMTSLRIISTSLLQEEHWDEAIYRDFLKDIDTETERLNNIIDSLLYLVSIEQVEKKLDLQNTSLNYLVAVVVKKLYPLAKQKNIELIIDDANVVSSVLDQGMMQQCIINLVSNGIKYTPEDGSVTVRISKDMGQVWISIIDTGIGIPKKDLDNIFDRFYRVDEARARSTGGTGLGLSIARQIASLHDGYIDVESTVDVGTTFSIVLPIRS
jgi:signal transduction histidine kinase